MAGDNLVSSPMESRLPRLLGVDPESWPGALIKDRLKGYVEAVGDGLSTHVRALNGSDVYRYKNGSAP